MNQTPVSIVKKRLNNTPFEALDKNSDGFLTTEDLVMLSIRIKNLRDALDTDNYAVLDEWAKTSAAVSTPKDWFKDHFAHPPIWTFLSKLDIAVGLFQGGADVNAPIAGVRKLEETARKAGKTKMEFHYFDDLDHTLNIGEYFVRGILPAGHKEIFEFIKRQTAN